ncbi:AzlC family ABC transporter permease [Desulfoluna spongiiphila]|uniref:Predicted branched-chain amino acid permease (Azaleucine resistance) n=1 Tax=Desulfoluna spongiiphila TaxID=419481 RepID=A0A1G5H3H8_9BACT|nr:AzlC family ABC transporter permease [Desulfoluna spongiiphila]SCY58237.1 Predicted branched-chain amino acid permease (azaleucine resistance) [Desulfoluna spongiiphila]VVS94762.1 branched-chain amino acid transport permease [Desulfoluna spongiiphila]
MGWCEEERATFLEGVRASLPLMLGVVPFALICGIASMEAGLPVWQAVVIPVVIFAGAAQLAVTHLFVMGAPAVVMVLTALVINLRFVMYSASISPHFRPVPGRWRPLLSYLLTDQAYALSLTKFNQPEGCRYPFAYTMGTGVTVFFAWHVCNGLGVLLGAGVPASWGLDFGVPLTFMALLVPAVQDRPTLVSALVSGVTAVVAAGLPCGLNIIVAALTGIGAGLLFEAGTLRETP